MSPAPVPADVRELYRAVNKVLCDHRMSNMTFDDGGPYQLVDLCSTPGTSIASGELELGILADRIIADAILPLIEGGEQRKVEALNGARPLPLDRDTLGRMVREAWVRWAQTQPTPKPSWLLPYDELAEPDKEADRQIGEAVARWTLIADAARFAASGIEARSGETEGLAPKDESPAPQTPPSPLLAAATSASVPSPLNLAWGKINALGGCKDGTEFWDGYSMALTNALAEIEKVGGRDPLASASGSQGGGEAARKPEGLDPTDESPAPSGGRHSNSPQDVAQEGGEDLRHRLYEQVRYSGQLQSIIFAICHDRTLPPNASDLHHYKMAAEFKAELATLRAQLAEAVRERDEEKAQKAKWHKVAMDAGVVTCSDGQFIFTETAARKTTSALAEDAIRQRNEAESRAQSAEQTVKRLSDELEALKLERERLWHAVQINAPKTDARDHGRMLRNALRSDGVSRCRAAQDGDCDWSQCPQTRDGEPLKSGRHCPLDKGEHDDTDS
jgi:hypothetical protein